jgi:predicted TPR repeat methyltransferase
VNSDKTSVAVRIFDKLADLYQQRFMDVSLYHDTLDTFCRLVTQQNAGILELACGPGNVTCYLLRQRPDFRILGTDLSPKMLELARINNPEASFQMLDLRELSHVAERYDGIVCAFGLPYLSKEDTLKLIRDAEALLTENGLLYLSTMEDHYSKSGLRKSSSGDEMYLHYHEADYLVEALMENGFEVMDLQRKSYEEKDGTPTIDLVLIARK